MLIVVAFLLDVRLVLHSVNVPIASGKNVVAGRQLIVLLPSFQRKGSFTHPEMRLN